MTDLTGSALMARIKELEEALKKIATTSKGYPNGSREGEIARKVLGDIINKELFS